MLSQCHKVENSVVDHNIVVLGLFPVPSSYTQSLNRVELEYSIFNQTCAIVYYMKQHSCVCFFMLYVSALNIKTHVSIRVSIAWPDLPIWEQSELDAML
jgi:hypothetical protein